MTVRRPNPPAFATADPVRPAFNRVVAQVVAKPAPCFGGPAGGEPPKQGAAAMTPAPTTDDELSNEKPPKPAQGFLIDPAAHTITPYTYNGDWRSIREALQIGSSPFTIVQIDDGDCVFVDDEGLLKPIDWFFALKGYHQPLAGRGLVLGTDRHGETVSANITLDKLAGRILHLRLTAVSPVITFLAWETDSPKPQIMSLRQVEAWMQETAQPAPPPHRLH